VYNKDMSKQVELTTTQVIKKDIWRHLYRVFPWLQKHFLKWHLAWHEKGRQPYHIGWLAPGKTLKELEKHLYNEWGFGNHFVAWRDNGQVLSWRKLENFDNQYHLRVFKDGEIRGHYEYTPESKPVDHFIEINEQAKIEDFKKFLGNYIVQKKYISHLRPDVNIAPESEITIDQGIKDKRK
jgi:hypothetical protein